MSVIKQNEEIIVRDEQRMNESGLLDLYMNQKMGLNLLTNQITKLLPEQQNNLKAELLLQENYLEQLNTKTELLLKIFKDENINYQKELRTLKEAHTEDELTKLAKTTTLNEDVKYERVEGGIKRVTTRINSVQDLIIQYASTQMSLLSVQEHIIKLKNELAKSEEYKEAQTKTLKQLSKSQTEIEEHFKNEGKDLNALLDAHAINRKKKDRVAQEIPV
jgi:hypothetical protein